MGGMTDDILQRIERFRFPRGAVVAERRNRGYTLHHALSGAPVARLRPTGRKDSVEVLYWSAWQERWAATGPFGRTILSLDEAPPLHRARGYLLGVVLTLPSIKKAESRAIGTKGGSRHEPART